MHSTMIGIELMHKEKRPNNMDGGLIINIASLVGLNPWHLVPIYTASKHAIVGFSRAFSVSWLILYLMVAILLIALHFPAWLLLQKNWSENNRIVSRRYED